MRQSTQSAGRRYEVCIVSPAFGAVLGTVLSRQGQCFVRSVPRWVSGFRLKSLNSIADRRDVVVIDVTGGFEVLLIYAR